MKNLIEKLPKKIKISQKEIFFFSFLFLYSILLIFFRVDLLGLLSLIFVSIITFFFSRKYNHLATILYVALFLRLTTVLLGNYLITLPDGWGDATEFERRAWEWSQNGFFGVIDNYPSNTKSYHISWLLAFIYSLTDRSIIMGQSICLAFGMGSLLLGVNIAKNLWTEKVSIKVGWIIALYPTLILYSCLFLREAFIWFFLLITVKGIVLWIEDRKLKSLSIILIGFLGATFFHGAMSIGLLVFLIIFFILFLKHFLKNLLYLKINQLNFVYLILFFIFSLFILQNIDRIPKLAALSHMLDYEQIIVEIANRNISNAGYPEWTVPKNLFELIYKTPIRLIYFLFSPFPWDINKLSHFMGLFDGLFFIILTLILLKNFKYIWSKNSLRIILIILASYLIIYGIATGNFGTGIRHRTKFIIIFIILVSPWIPNFVLDKKRTNYLKK